LKANKLRLQGPQAAAKGGHLKIMEKLLEVGAHENATGPCGNNAIKAAAEGGHLEVFEKLLASGATCASNQCLLFALVALMDFGSGE
jgi:ankyrin repeat protein